MKKFLVIVTLSALLAACASPPAATGPAMPVEMAPPGPALNQAARASDGDAFEPDVPAKLPALELSSDLMYEVLASELAYQRGDWQPAYATLLAAAQQTRDPRIARRAMEIAMSAKQAAEALTAIRLWREIDPDSEEALQYYLGFVVLNDKFDEAREIFALRLAQASPAARGLTMYQIQRFLARAKDKAAVFTLLETLLAPYKDTLEAHLVLAQGAFGADDAKRAVAEAQAARALDPESELALLTLVQVTPEPARAVKFVSDFLRAHPQARDVRGAYARMLIDDKQYPQARREFETLLTQQPNNLTTLYALGILCMQANDDKAAERYFKTYLTALETRPDDERNPAQVQALLAQLAQERGDAAGAIAWLERIEDGDGRGPVYFGAHLKRAQLVAKQGDLPAARKLLADLHTEDADEQVQLVLADAQLLRDAGQPGQAFTVLDAAKQRFPDNADLLYDYAMTADSVNRGDAMEAALRRVIALAPDNQHAYNALGYWLAEHNQRLPEAFELISKALALAPGDPFIMDSMGWVQFRLGRLAEAEDLLRRAYAQRPDAEIAVHLGEVLWRRGQTAEAQKFWRDARARDPKNDALKNTLARLNAHL